MGFQNLTSVNEDEKMSFSLMGMNIDIVNVVLMLVAIITLYMTSRGYLERRKKALFDLQQKVLVESEQVKSEWYDFKHENNSLIHQVQQNSALSPQHKNILLDFLNSQADFFDNCILDASALADDVQKNVDNFSEADCQNYLRKIEPGRLKLVRNRGVPQKKLNELMERHSQPQH